MLERTDVDSIMIWRGLHEGALCYQFTVVMIDGDEFDGEPCVLEVDALCSALDQADAGIEEREDNQRSCMEDT